MATLCWGASATFGKAVFNGSLFAGQPMISPLVLNQTRTTFSVVLLAVFLLIRYGRQSFRIDARDLRLCLLVGALGLGASAFFYYFAIQKATVAIAITVQYTAPVWVLLYMAVRGREQATGRRIFAVLLALVGVALTIGLFYSGNRLNAYGVAAAMLASFCFAYYNVAAQALVMRRDHLQVMFYALCGASVALLAMDPPWHLTGRHYSGAQWGFLVLFACFSMLLPFALYFTGLKYLDPTRAVVTSCLEPVFAILLAFAFLGEKLTEFQVVGIVAVLAATVIVQTQPRNADGY